MFGSIKTGIVAIFGAIVLIFGFVFKLRGDKIEELEIEAGVAEQEAAVTARTVENEKEAAQFVADNRVAKVEAENEESSIEYDPNTKFYI